MNYCKDLPTPSDLSPESLKWAVKELEGIAQKELINGKWHLTVVCGVDAANLWDKVEERPDVSILERNGDYLKKDAWFLTDGSHLIFSPGA